MTYRFATAADVLRFYSERPPQTLRAIIVVMGDEPVAIVGLANEGAHAKLFSEYKPEMKGRLRCMAVLRAIKHAMQFVERCPLPVVAVVQPDEPDSPRLLKRLGFELYQPSEDGDVYQYGIPVSSRAVS